MLHQEFGSVMLGFTAEIKCLHCKNIKPMQVRQTYVKQSAFLIPMGTSHNAIFKYCPICEKEDYIIKWKPMFSGESKMNEVISLLEGGKELIQVTSEHSSE